MAFTVIKGSSPIYYYSKPKWAAKEKANQTKIKLYLLL